jgi:hypothetical protein
MSTSNIILLVGGFVLGILFYTILESLTKYLKSKKIIDDSSNQFKEIIKNLKTGTTNFVSRVNETIFIDTNLKDWKDVSIIYLIDKQMVCIFKDNKCLYTTEIVDETLKNKLISEICEKYKTEIDDIIEIMGNKISKSEFESRIDEFKSSSMEGISFNFVTEEQDSEVDQIVIDNEYKFDLDEILDKLAKNGYDRNFLSEEEIDFLDQKSKE